MNTNTITRFVTATAATICISTSWAAPVGATTDNAAGGSTVWTEPDAGQVIAQRKARAAHEFVVFAAARAAYAAMERRAAGPVQGHRTNDPARPCAKFPEFCAESWTP